MPRLSREDEAKRDAYQATIDYMQGMIFQLHKIKTQCLPRLDDTQLESRLRTLEYELIILAQYAGHRTQAINRKKSARHRQSATLFMLLDEPLDKQAPAPSNVISAPPQDEKE